MGCIVVGMVSPGLYSGQIVDSGLPANFRVLEFRCGLTTHHTYFLYFNMDEAYCGWGGFPRFI